jgi:simple sugar transport system substrate-binding protein
MNIVRNTIAACAAGSLLSFAAQPVVADTHEEPVEITFIHACCPGALFWEPMLFAEELAGRLFNANVDVQQGENDPVRMNNIIETAIANEVDGIVVMISFEGAYTENIQKARDAGIVVIVANEDEVLGGEATARQSYVGQDFVASGYRIGKYMVEQHGLGEGDFCVTPVEEPDLIYGQKRYEGTKKALDEAGVASELIGTGPVMETALTIIAEYLLANPETDCIISLGLTPMSVAPLAMQEAGLENLPNGGFDVGPEVVEYIKDGTTTATMDQQAFWQGFMPVLFIAMATRYGLEPADFDTGAGMITKENVHLAEQWVGKYR